MKTNYIQKLMLTAILLLSVAFTANAQQNPKYLCETNSNTALDLALDVVGNGFHAGGGQWYALPPGTYSQNPTDATVTGVVAGTHLVEANKVGEIFVATGKNVGRYDFVFVSIDGESCIPIGNQKLATVIILEAPKPVSHSLSLCSGVAHTLDLATLISSTLPTPVTYTGAPAGFLTGSNLTIDATFEGQIDMNYSVTHTGAPASFCNASTITINVVRSGEAPKLVGANNINSCSDAINGTTLNLNTKLTATVPGGTWSVSPTTPATSTPKRVQLSGTGNHIATFDGVANTEVYTFTYTLPTPLPACYAGATNPQFTVTIKDDLAPDYVDNTLNVCKADNPNGVIDMLRDGLGLNIPLSTGTWNLDPAHTNPSDVTVTDGLFEVANASPGTYKYIYTTSNTGICGVINKSVTLTIEVTDTATKDERIVFCKIDLDTAGTKTLSDYVPGLPATGVTWTTTATGFAGTTAGTPPVTTITTGTITNAELHAKGAGTHKFDYSYDSGTCGIAEGSLYVSVTDALDMQNVTVKYCRPDLPADGVNLTNVLGIDVPGSWSFENLADNPSSGGNITGNIFKETITPAPTGDVTYKATFSPNSTNCGATKVTVSIIVTNNNF